MKQYAERDAMAMDMAGNYYCRHVSAMTEEGLHAKSDIAAELAWRDMQIDRLRAALAEVVPAFNMTRIIMECQAARDDAGAIVERCLEAMRR